MKEIVQHPTAQFLWASNMRENDCRGEGQRAGRALAATIRRDCRAGDAAAIDYMLLHGMEAIEDARVQAIAAQIPLSHIEAWETGIMDSLFSGARFWREGFPFVRRVKAIHRLAAGVSPLTLMN